MASPQGGEATDTSGSGEEHDVGEHHVERTVSFFTAVEMQLDAQELTRIERAHGLTTLEHVPGKVEGLHLFRHAFDDGVVVDATRGVIFFFHLLSRLPK